MKRIHTHLTKRYKWYHKWHKHPKHKLFHWLTLVAFSELALMFALTVLLVADGKVSTSGAAGCLPQYPLLNIQTQKLTAQAGTPIAYQISLSNPDNGCGKENFSVALKMVDGLNWSVNPQSFNAQIPSHDSAGKYTVTKKIISVVSHPATAPGTYHLQVVVTNTNHPQFVTRAGVEYTIPDPSPVVGQ